MSVIENAIKRIKKYLKDFFNPEVYTNSSHIRNLPKGTFEAMKNGDFETKFEYCKYHVARAYNSRSIPKQIETKEDQQAAYAYSAYLYMLLLDGKIKELFDNKEKIGLEETQTPEELLKIIGEKLDLSRKKIFDVELKRRSDQLNVIKENNQNKDKAIIEIALEIFLTTKKSKEYEKLVIVLLNDKEKTDLKSTILNPDKLFRELLNQGIISDNIKKELEIKLSLAFEHDKDDNSDGPTKLTQDQFERIKNQLSQERLTKQIKEYREIIENMIRMHTFNIRQYAKVVLSHDEKAISGQIDELVKKIQSLRAYIIANNRQAIDEIDERFYNEEKKFYERYVRSRLEKFFYSQEANAKEKNIIDYIVEVQNKFLELTPPVYLTLYNVRQLVYDCEVQPPKKKKGKEQTKNYSQLYTIVNKFFFRYYSQETLKPLNTQTQYLNNRISNIQITPEIDMAVRKFMEINNIPIEFYPLAFKYLYLKEIKQAKSDNEKINNSSDEITSREKIIAYLIEAYANGIYGTLGEAAETADVTKEQMKNYIRKLKKSHNPSEMNLLQRYKAKVAENSKASRQKGGQNGKRKTTYSIGEIETWFNMIVNGDMTLDEVSKQTGIPKTVIHENLANNLTLEQKLELEITYDRHKKSAANNYKNDTENGPSFHQDGESVTNSLQRSKR